MQDPSRAFQDAVARADWPAAETALRALIAGAGRVGAPERAALHYNLGLVLRRQDRQADAIAAFDMALAQQADHHNALFERAAALMDAALMDNGDLADADTAFAAYLAVVPGDEDALVNRARIALRQGRPRAALDLISTVDTGAARLVAVEALIGIGQLDMAREAAARLYRDSPKARPALLKALSQGPRGTLPLRVSGIG